MSTKIYNGFQITKGKTLLSLQKNFNEFREKVREIAEEKTCRYLANHATFLMDSVAFSDTPDNSRDSYLVQAHVALMEEQREVRRSQQRNPAVDFQCEVTIHPVNKDTVLGIIFSEQKDIIDSLLANDWVEEFGYYDNADKPEDISEEDWTARGALWEEALGDKSPALSGFTITCSDVNGGIFAPKIERILEFLPSFEERVNRCADHESMKFYFQSIAKTQQEKHFSAYLKWKQSEVGGLAVAARRNKAQVKLTEEVTEDMLMNRRKKVEESENAVA